MAKQERPRIPVFRSGNDRKKWAERMLGITDILRVIRNGTHDKIYFKDRYSRFFFFNKGHETDLKRNVTRRIILGMTDFDIFAFEHAIVAWRDERRIMSTGKPMVGKMEKEIWPDGRVAWVLSSKFPLRDVRGKIIGTWGVSRDMTAIKRSEEEQKLLNSKLQEANKRLAELSQLDPLSGLYNQRYLFDVLGRTLKLRSRLREKGGRSEFSLVLFDVDRFKHINDSWGHLAGDAVIRHTAGLLRSSVRGTDFVFRYGGDEFLVLLSDTRIADARLVGNKILSVLRRYPCRFERKSIRVTASAGISGTEEAGGVNSLLKKADERMYYSKNHGRNRLT